LPEHLARRLSAVSAVRRAPGGVIEALPFSKFSFEIDVEFVSCRVLARTCHGKTVDLGHAQFLIDKTLLRDSIDWFAANRKQLIANYNGAERFVNDNRAIWDHYCQRHLEKYDESFRPDVDPDWS
jgi:hypothetical protein